MPIPQRAPGLELLKSVLSGDAFAGAIQRIGLLAEVGGKYVHWDELRRRQPPEGLTVEQCWGVLRLARQALRVDVPLRAEGGQSFWFARTDALVRSLHEIDQHLGTKLDVVDPALANDSIRDRYILRSLAEEAIASSQLEGASTTRRVAKEMLLQGRAPRSPGERMITNNFRAMSFVREQRDEPLTPTMLNELHRILTEHTLDANEVGRLRTSSESVTVQAHSTGEVVHVPPTAQELPQRMEALCAFANASDDDVFVHPVVRAVLLHFMVGYDHPFVDGNGRTARAVFYWSLLRHNYWLAEFLPISRVIKKAPAKYGRAYLLTETDHGDATYFILHQLAVIQEAIKDLDAYLANKAREVKHAEKLLKDPSRFNHRQQALLAHALRHPNGVYTIDAYRREHGVVYQTARTDLLALARAGFLTKKKAGKAFVFGSGTGLRGR
ncbi:MAG: Fic family protein [Myxococcaceae bacterium]